MENNSIIDYKLFIELLNNCGDGLLAMVIAIIAEAIGKQYRMIAIGRTPARALRDKMAT